MSVPIERIVGGGTAYITGRITDAGGVTWDVLPDYWGRTVERYWPGEVRWGEWEGPDRDPRRVMVRSFLPGVSVDEILQVLTERMTADFRVGTKAVPTEDWIKIAREHARAFLALPPGEIEAAVTLARMARKGEG